MSSIFDPVTPVNIKLYWFDRSNDPILYSEMDDSHLRNAYFLALRTDNRKRYIPYLLEELERRGYKQSNPEWFL
jgi:hypothetical protein